MRGESVVEEESLEDTVEDGYAIAEESESDNVEEFELDTEIADDVDPDHKEFYKSLSDEEKFLLTLRDELYDGGWKKMEKDLNDRLESRPYIKRLSIRINEDLARIEKMRGYEKTHDVNLADYVDEQNTK